MKPDKERLEELKNYVDEYVPLESISRDLIALIDAALAEPSDQDVARILDWLDDSEFDCLDRQEYFRTIKKLRGYFLKGNAQKPKDEAVQRAIDWQEAQKASAQNDWERAGAEWRMEPGAQEQHDERMASFDLAIQALRQMGSTEPCEWCDKDGPETWNYTRSGKYIPEYQAPRNYCRACGRKLVK